jgi:hypothetical protein
MGKNDKRSKARKDKAERLDTNYDDNRFNSLVESENEDADFRTVTVSLIELRNIIQNEVKNQLSDINKSLTCSIGELQNDLALRFNCMDNRLNETLTKKDFTDVMNNMKLEFIKLEKIGG